MSSNARTGTGGSAKGASAKGGAESGATGGGATGGASAEPWPTAVPELRGARIAVYLVLAVLGGLAGVAGALLQSAWFPGGLLLALAGAGGLFWAGAKFCRTKGGAIAPGAGWAVLVFLLTASRPEGDFVFGAGFGSYVFLFGGTLVAVMCATIALPAPPVVRHKSP